jgi:5-oxoprolinase (ATP-hydrolysing) subunit A
MAAQAPSLVNDLIYQLGALDDLARVPASGWTTSEPHGALYHSALAAAVVEAIRLFDAGQA